MTDRYFDPIVPSPRNSQHTILRSNDAALNYYSDNTSSSASATTFHTQQSVSSISTLSADARARRAGLDVESEGFKLTHNDEFFSEVATKVMAVLTDYPKTSEISDVDLLRQHYRIEFLRLFAKALVFRMKIINALRSGSLAKERRVDALAERCYTRLGLGTSGFAHILLNSDAPPDQPATYSHPINAGRSLGSSAASGVVSVSNKSTLDRDDPRWRDMSRPASPIRIRQPTLNQNVGNGKIRVNLEVSNPPASHPLNLPQNLNYQHGFEGGQSTVVSNPARDESGPSYRQYRPMPPNNNLHPDNYFPEEHMPLDSSPRYQSHQYPPFDSVNGRYSRDGVSSPNSAYKTYKSHAVVDHTASSDAEGVGTKDDFMKESSTWRQGSAMRINGSAIRVKPDGVTADSPIAEIDEQKITKELPPIDEDEKDAFVPLQTISFGNKHKHHSKRSGATSPTKTFSIDTQGGVQYPIIDKSSTSSVSKAEGVTASPSAKSPNEKKRDGSLMTSTQKSPEIPRKIPYLEAVDLPMTKVVAPANLPEGYTFEARVGNKRFLATVPTGGVSKGETFFTYIRELERVEVSVPVGEWRDDLCDCCAFGPFHPLFLNACFCPHIALGQIMSRLGLDYSGHAAPTFISRQTCWTLIIIVATYVLLNIMIFILAANDYVLYGDYPPSWQLISCFVALNVIFIVYTYYAISATRASLRSRYMIPGRRCGRYEDCCCALFCTFCTMTQMGRHTGDYQTFRGICCNSTGLPQHVTIPRNPDATFYEEMHDVDASNKIVY